MTNTTKRIIFLRKFAALTTYACLNGINFIVTSYYRNAKEQNQLFKEGKSTCDGYQKKSAHQSWLAMDIAIVEGGQTIWVRDAYEQLGQFWLAMGGTWDDSGDGDIDDPYHFEWKE
jgi:uncharacterized protein YcbK (DUF882 family)